MQAYNKTDQQIHLLSQIIAKANRSFVPPKEDDSHINLAFDLMSSRLYGRWIDHNGDRLILALHIPSLTFQWITPKLQVIVEVSAVGKQVVEIEQELATSLPPGLNKDPFREAMHYEIPVYPFSGDKISALSEEGQSSWIRFRALANLIASDMLRYVQMEAEIRIWPHHFDTGIYVEPTDWLGVGFGLAMEDSMVGAPYLYLAPYRKDTDSFAFEQAPALESGRWELSGGWKGAVLSLADLEGITTSEQIRMAHSFVESSITWYFSQH